MTLRCLSAPPRMGIAEGSRSACREGAPGPELPPARGTGVRVRPGRAASSGLCFISATGTDTSRTQGRGPENKPCTGGPRQAGLTKPCVRGTAQTRRHQGSGRASPSPSAGRLSVSAPPSPSGPLSHEPWAQLYRHWSLLQTRAWGPQTPLCLSFPRREASTSEQRWAQGLVSGQRPGSGGAVDQVSLLGGGQVPSPAAGAGRDHHSATPLPPPRFWPEAVDTERGRPGGAYVQGRRSGVQAKPGLGRG